jgi:hypothetical protein
LGKFSQTFDTTKFNKKPWYLPMVGYFLKQLGPILDLSKNANTITFESKNNNSENIMLWLRGWVKFLNR